MARYRQGRIRMFAAIDGSDNPSLPQDRESFAFPAAEPGIVSRGVAVASGRESTPEFTIDIVRDPTGVNRDPGLGGCTAPGQRYRCSAGHASAANLKYVLAPDNGVIQRETRCPYGQGPGHRHACPA